ncbi:hypothetical protein GF362_04480 [Candidatus Dojkabacteria bacterium]|nr:hypothetical protein [Candidatus Dojkabacteria bacterium]
MFQFRQFLNLGFIFSSQAATRIVRSSGGSRGVDIMELVEEEPMLLLFSIIGFAVGLLVIRLLFKLFAKGVKNASLEKKSLNSVLFEIRLPQSNEIEIQAADQMLSGFLGIKREVGLMDKLFGAGYYISFEIVAFPESIRFYVNCPKQISTLVEKQINGAYPDAEIIVTEEYNMFMPKQKVEFCSLELEEKESQPIRTYEELPQDVLSSITAVMSKLQAGQAMAVQLVIVPPGHSWRKDAKKYVKKVRDNNSDPEKSKIEVDEDTLTAIEKKAEKAGFATDIRLVSVAKEEQIAKTNLDNLVYVFDQFSKQGANKFKKVKYKFSKRNQRKFIKKFIYRMPTETMVLNTAEIASIYHFPNQNVNTPHIHWLTAKRAPASGEIPSTFEPGSIYLGINQYRGLKKKIYLSLKDRRRHFYYVGKTGAGKTVLLQHMIYQDIHNGQGLAFLDPHGDAVEWLLERIPPERAEDVIYFNPADVDRPIGMNIMEWYTEQDKHIIVNGFLGLLSKIFDPHNQGITGPRFEQAVRNSMLTVMSRKGTSLVEVMRVLQNDEYAKSYFPYLDDEVVKRYWTDQIAKTQDFHKSEILGYIVSKFDRFITNKLMRNIISQSSSGFDFRKAMDEGKIVLVNLSKGLIGEENSQFLGLLLIPKMLQAAMSRADVPQDQRRDFYLYVDEFQNFATPDFAQILSEARKYRLNLVVANQYIAQMSDEIRDAVFGNAGSIGSFKVGVNDAQYLANEFDPVFDQNDLINLENLNMYVKLLSKGEYHKPFSMALDTDLVFKTPGDKQMGDLVKQLSRFKYGRDKNLVEAEIKAREEGSISGVDPSNNVTPKPTQPTFKPPLK